MGSAAETPKAVAIIQARLGSMRFPGKVLAEVGGKPLVEFMIERVVRAETISQVVLAVPDVDLASPLAEIAARRGVTLIGGDSTNVLARFAKAASECEESIVVRLTADCPLVDPEVIDMAVREFDAQGSDYLRTDLSFPDGLDVEVTTKRALLTAAAKVTSPFEQEHVMPSIANNPSYQRTTISSKHDLGHLRLTVDLPEDLSVIQEVLASLGSQTVSLDTLGELFKGCPEIFARNSAVIRDEGASMTDSQKLWRRATRAIPGGVSLLSKRPDMHLPDKWPTYFTSAKGCLVTSLDDRQYLDMGLMGVGTSILGYGDPRVDEAVTKVVQHGVVSTLNCPEEVLLAERLVEMHPWSGQARFARSGGEACAMAVRIARAASARNAVAICGYHGWHDWYLAANLSEDSALDGHLLPGLSTRGVPRALVGTALTFDYNDLAGLQALVSGNDIGVIIMEVERSVPPRPGFLETVRDIATQNGIVLIFDESTSGFRQMLGGHHLTLGVNPDIAVFGKTLGNGFAITAVLGADEVMDVARDLFISSTFWSERIGPAAALASLRAMAEDEAPQRVHQLGLRYRESLKTSVGLAGENLLISGLPALSTVGLSSFSDGALLKTFATTKLLEKGILAGPAFYAALPHEQYLDQFIEAMAEVLLEAEAQGEASVARSLADQRLATTGFARLA